MTDLASRLLTASDTLRRLATDRIYLDSVERAVALLDQALNAGQKVLVFGNGGSAADAQHIAAELVGRFVKNRAPIAAQALGTNAAYVTAWSNDAAYEDIYARELSAIGRPGDVAWGISTSGSSPNVVNALRRARGIGMRTIALTGAGGQAIGSEVDVLIAVPVTETARVQEVHQVTYHAMCAALEDALG